MLEAILWIVFLLACVLVSAVILLQEGKGGGLGEAFGGVGAQTFGVKAAGINRFTTIVACVVVLAAILITRVRSTDSAVVFDTPAAPGSDATELPGTAPGTEPGAVDDHAGHDHGEGGH